MNTEQLQGQWQQLKSEVRQQSGKLIDDDISKSEGQAEKLIGRITERYGIGLEEARRKFTDFLAKLEQPGGVMTTLSEGANVLQDKATTAAQAGREFAARRPLVTTGIAVLVGAWLVKRLFHG